RPPRGGAPDALVEGLDLTQDSGRARLGPRHRAQLGNQLDSLGHRTRVRDPHRNRPGPEHLHVVTKVFLDVRDDQVGLESPDLLEPDLVIANIEDRKSTRLNSSHVAISYAVFCLKKKIRMNNH